MYARQWASNGHPAIKGMSFNPGCVPAEGKRSDSAALRSMAADTNSSSDDHGVCSLLSNEGLDARFVQAVEEDDARELEQALEEDAAEGEDSRHSNFRLRSRKVYHLACARDAVNCCELLLRPSSFPRVPINAQSDVDGRTALHFAGLHHSGRCIDLLLKSGADVAVKNRQKMLPVEEALRKITVEWDYSMPAEDILEMVRQKDLTAIKPLIEASEEHLASVAIKLAGSSKLAPLIALLLAGGPWMLNRTSEKAGSPGTLVDHILEKIISRAAGAAPSPTKSLDKSPLRPALKTLNNATSPRAVYVVKKKEADKQQVGGSSDATRKLLECVLLFNPRLSAHRRSFFLAPLLRAAQANDDILISLLLNSGAPVNEADSEGNTALHWILRQATPLNGRSVDMKAVQVLLDAGANVLAGNKAGASPVHTAAGHGHSGALDLLLEKEPTGANVLALSKETPLHYAAANNQLFCAAILLKHRANRNVSNLRSMKPSHLAISPEMYALLCMDDAAISKHSAEQLVDLARASPRDIPRLPRPKSPASPALSPKRSFSASARPALNSQIANATKVFVGGLAHSTTSTDLKKVMEEMFGKVADAQVFLTVNSSGLTRSRGFGFVVFDKLKDAEAARSRGQVTIMGKQVDIRKAMPEKAKVISPVPSEKSPSQVEMEPINAWTARPKQYGQEAEAEQLVLDFLVAPADPSASYQQAYGAPCPLTPTIPATPVEELLPSLEATFYENPGYFDAQAQLFPAQSSGQMDEFAGLLCMLRHG